MIFPWRIIIIIIIILLYAYWRPMSNVEISVYSKEGLFCLVICQNNYANYMCQTCDHIVIIIIIIIIIIMFSAKLKVLNFLYYYHHHHHHHPPSLLHSRLGGSHRVRVSLTNHFFFTVLPKTLNSFALDWISSLFRSIRYYFFTCFYFISYNILHDICYQTQLFLLSVCHVFIFVVNYWVHFLLCFFSGSVIGH